MPGVKPPESSSDQPGTLSVRTFSRPYAPYHDRYQKYYREGLRRYCRAVGGRFEIVHLSRLPRVLAALRTARDNDYYGSLGVPGLASVVDRLARHLDGRITTPSGIFQMSTGQYVITTGNGRNHGVCIDTADSHEIQSPQLCEWSDVYFKTNFWPSAPYPMNVMPLVNADPLALESLDQFRSSRSAPKEFDVCAVIRIWEGEGVEHNIRLLKAIANAKCDKFVLAVLFPGEGENHILRYLHRARVPTTTRGLKPPDLWRKTARSTLNVVRLGVHYCVPWRVTGSLATGSCVVLDRPPLSTWPRPLLEGVNYLSLGLNVVPGIPVALQQRYDEVPRLIEDWLSQPELIERIARSNGEYFDRFLEPQRVGDHIVQTVEKLERRTSPDVASSAANGPSSPQS